MLFSDKICFLSILFIGLCQINPQIPTLMRRIAPTSVLLFSVLFLFNFSFSQVGIGTTTPDGSSILDMSSTTQGVLTPRMTTTQRTAISSPAEGLLVYDTDENTFYFYQSSSWSKIDSDLKRNKYKLIRSASDLADELTAGGGSTYQLNTNTYYEVNGAVTLAAPIDLNDAYLSGLDANEDKLLRAGGPMFSGSSGGSIRNLTLVASEGSIFNLSGTGAESLVFQNSIIAGSGEATSDSMGTISNFDLVFMNIINIGVLDDGITYNNIDNLLLSNIGWFDSNSGTYETYTGSFDLIEKVSGFSKVPSGATAIDVSANPTVGSGNILKSPFSGAGTYVNGYSSGTYSGYFFSSAWNVDCPGLETESDESATADFYYSGSFPTAYLQTISNGTAVEVDASGNGATYVSTNLFRFSASGNGNRLTYDGMDRRSFQVTASLSVNIANASSDYYAFMIAKNGTVITESNALVFVESDSQIQNVAINTIVELDQSDYIEVYIQRITGSGSDSLYVYSENLSIR